MKDFEYIAQFDVNPFEAVSNDMKLLGAEYIYKLDETEFLLHYGITKDHFQHEYGFHDYAPLQGDTDKFRPLTQGGMEEMMKNFRAEATSHLSTLPISKKKEKIPKENIGTRPSQVAAKSTPKADNKTEAPKLSKPPALKLAQTANDTFKQSPAEKEFMAYKQQLLRTTKGSFPRTAINLREKALRKQLAEQDIRWGTPEWLAIVQEFFPGANFSVSISEVEESNKQGDKEENKKFMEEELSVATDNHELKVQENLEGKNVLQPKEKEISAKETSPMPSDKTTPALNILTKDGGKEANEIINDEVVEKGNEVKKETKSNEAVPAVNNADPATPQASEMSLPKISETIASQNETPPTAHEQKELSGKSSKDEQEAILNSKRATFQAQASAVRNSLQQEIGTKRNLLEVAFKFEKDKVVADSAGKIQALTEGVKNSKNNVENFYVEALNKLKKQFEVDSAHVFNTKEVKYKLLADRIMAKKNEFSAYIQNKEAEPETFAIKEGMRVQQELSTAADLCLQQSSEVASRYEKKAQKEAALKVGQESANDIRGKIKPMQQNLLDLAKELKGNYSEYKEKVFSELDKTEAQLKPDINAIADDTKSQLKAEYDQLAKSLSNDKTKTLQSIDELLGQSVSALIKLKTKTIADLESLYHQNSGGIDQLDRYFMAGINHLEQDTLEALMGPGDIYMPGITALLSDATDRLQQLNSNSSVILGAQVDSAKEGMNELSNLNIQQTESNLSSAKETTAKIEGQVKTKIAKVLTSHQEQAAKHITNLEKNISGSIDQGIKSVDEGLLKVKEKIETQNNEAKQKLTARTNENIEKAKLPLNDDNKSRSNAAAIEAGKDSWWDAVKGALVAIATIVAVFIVVLIVAAIIVVALAAIGITVGIWAVVAVIGIGFLLYAGYQSYQKRSAQMKDGKLSGWGVVGMILSDVVGWTDIQEGFTNKDMVTGENLSQSLFQRSQRVTTGVFTLVMTALGVRGGIKGLRTRFFKVAEPVPVPEVVKPTPGIFARGMSKIAKISKKVEKGLQGLGKSLGEKIHTIKWGNPIKSAGKSIGNFFKSGKKGNTPKEETTGKVEEDPSNKKVEEPVNNNPSTEQKSGETEIKDEPTAGNQEEAAKVGKAAVTDQDYLSYAKEAYKVYSEELPNAIQKAKDIAGDLGEVSGRVKRPESAANRLQRAVANGWLKKLDSVAKAISNLWDAVGTRIVLKKGDPHSVDLFVDNLCNAIKKGDIEVISVNSLTGKNGTPYFTEAHLLRIRNAALSAGKSIKALPKEYDTGYTVGTIYVEYANGVKGELQIIGKEVLKIANAEHWVYDAFLEKPYAEYLDNFSDPEMKGVVKSLIERIRKPAEKLSESLKAQYNDYLNAAYKNARGVESGTSSQPVTLPEGLPKELTIESLLKTDELINGLKSGKASKKEALNFLNSKTEETPIVKQKVDEKPTEPKVDEFKSDYSGVEIVDKGNNPLGEFDGIDMSKKAFIEDKSASGLSKVNPKTKLPSQTPIEWAIKQIFDKTLVRIENLKNMAVSTRSTKSGSQAIPTLAEITGFRKLHFRINSNEPALIKAVEVQLKNLKSKYPDWEFSAEFGKK